MLGDSGTDVSRQGWGNGVADETSHSMRWKWGGGRFEVVISREALKQGTLTKR